MENWYPVRTLAIFMSLGIIPVSKAQLIMSVNGEIMHCIVDFAIIKESWR